MLNRNLIICSIFLIGVSLHAMKLKITTDEPKEIKISNTKNSLLNFNFYVKSAKLIENKEKTTKLSILDKGLVLTPLTKNANGDIVISNDKGESYFIHFEASKHYEDVIFSFKDLDYEPITSNYKKPKYNFETGKVEKDIKNIIKALMNNAKLTGFSRKSSSIKIRNPEFVMIKEARYTGAYYVVDKWYIQNTTNQELYFDEEDFYTKGIIAISITKNRLEPGETAILFSVINKASLK